MKKFYYLSLMTLLFIAWGVNASAQTYDFKDWAGKNATIVPGNG